jgi:ribonuclease P protein subunit POP4
MHELWGTGSASTFAQRLLKADLHGAVIRVSKSTCPHYVHLSGIVVQETRNVFKIITVQDRLLCVPKQHSVFELEYNSYTFSIYGDQFRFQPSERAVRKFKPKATLEL